MTVLHDLKIAARTLVRSKGFTPIVVLTLALGIGANTTAFSLLDAVVLEPLAYPEPGRLVVAHSRSVGESRLYESVSEADFVDWRTESRSFERLAAYEPFGLAITEGGDPEEVPSLLISPALLPALGVVPMIGRGFVDEEEQPGRANVVLLSHRLFERRFAGDSSVVGRTLSLDGEPYTVVGVMGPDFRFGGEEVRLWAPLELNPSRLSRRNRSLTVVGRLRPQVTVEQAGAELDRVARGLAEAHPDTNQGWGASVLPLHEHLVGDVRPALVLLLGAVAFVLLIACANVANLLLVRLSHRRRELALRTALGAGRSALLRQLSIEALLLALVGGALGLLVAAWGIRIAVALAPAGVPRLADAGLDPTVLLFTLALSVLIGLGFGIAPVLARRERGTLVALQDGGRGSGGARKARVASALVVVEIALSLALLIGAGLLLRSFATAARVDPGFRADGVLATQIFLSRANYPEGHQKTAFFNGLLERLRALPEVISAGAVTALPMSDDGIDFDLPFSIVGKPDAVEEDEQADLRVITPGYLETLGIPILRGRSFDERDREDASPVVLINETMARRYWPSGSPVGELLDISFRGDGPYEIVGVVGNVRHRGLDQSPRPEFYLPFLQMPFSGMNVTVRTTGDPNRLTGAVKAEVLALDDQQPLFSVHVLSDLVSSSISDRRFNLQLIGGFATLALVLAAIGIFGVLSNVVTQRTKEIGIRMAMGARRVDVVRTVLRRELVMTAVGLAAGAVVAFFLTRTLASFLFGISATDLWTYGGAALVLVATACLGALRPVLRATRVDPIVALRYE